MISNTLAPIHEETQQEYGFNLLIEEPPLQVLPSLAEAIGLEESIVLQQMHYYERKGFGKTVNGARWIFNTYATWRSVFPFWSEMTIRRIFGRLEKIGLVETCQPEGGISRRKYYRINRGMLNLIRKGKLNRPSVQNEQIVCSNRSLPITETTYKESKESKEDLIVDEASFSAEWKPIPGTKEEKLKRIKPPRDYPSEREFDTFLSVEGLDGILTYRPDLYSSLCDQRWHQWREPISKWVRIRDWRQYVKALDELLLTR